MATLLGAFWEEASPHQSFFGLPWPWPWPWKSKKALVKRGLFGNQVGCQHFVGSAKNVSKMPLGGTLGPFLKGVEKDLNIEGSWD